MTDWHHIFGLMLTDLFTGTPYTVELEKDLSIKKQFLDIVIVRKTAGKITKKLPDGLDNLTDHLLITYKSLHESLNAWVIKELMGHYVNYRKQVSDKKLLPEKLFKLYAVTTRLPKKFFSKITPTQTQKGVYTINWGTDQICVIVLSQIAKTKVNAFWCLISSNKQLIDWGMEHYEQRTNEISTVIKQLIDMYKKEGIKVSYTFEDFHREMAKEYLHLLSPDEVLSHYKPSEVLSHYKPSEVLNHYKPEERLLGLKPEELARIKVALEEMEKKSKN